MRILGLLVVLCLALAACSSATDVPVAEAPADAEQQAVEQPAVAPEPTGAPTAEPEAEALVVELDGEGTIEGGFLTIRGTSNLPDDAALTTTVRDSDGYEETLHPVVSDGVYEVPVLLDTFADGPLAVVVSVETGGADGQYVQMATVTEDAIAYSEGPKWAADSIMVVNFTVER